MICIVPWGSWLKWQEVKPERIRAEGATCLPYHNCPAGVIAAPALRSSSKDPMYFKVPQITQLLSAQPSTVTCYNGKYYCDKTGDRAFYLPGFWLVCCLGVGGSWELSGRANDEDGEVHVGGRDGESNHLYFAGCSHLQPHHERGTGEQTEVAITTNKL